MTATEEFETLLKDVVNAKRLSASRMNALTDVALKDMQHDTEMVSILYRTHKALTSVTSKISSLYVFDALCRAARSHSTKNNVTGDISTQPGNSATFLLKVAGIVEGLFQDMIATGSQEAKEKTKKIYDIWVKGSTFPPDIMALLADVMKGPEQVLASTKLPLTPPMTSQPTTDPRVHASAVTQALSMPPVPAVDPQAALLALLTQAAATASVSQPPISQPSMTAGPGAPQLGAVQLAVLQQLAHTAAPVTSVPNSLTPAELVNVQKYGSSSSTLNGSSRPPPEPLTMVRSEQRYNGYRSPEHESRTNPHYDDRDNSRGRYRGGFRGRGRGGRNWDERDRRHRDSENDDRSPPQQYRGGRSRSRSPLHNGERRPTRFGSPSRRQHREPTPPQSLPGGGSGRQTEPGKDEFGRDIRPESPLGSPNAAQKSPPTPMSPTRPSTTTVDPRRPAQPNALPSAPAPTPQLPTTNQSSVPNTNPSNTFSNSNNKQTELVSSSTSALGLESFNLATFDYTVPASWEALAKMWESTNGYMPAQEQLLEFVMQCTANGGQPPIGGVQSSGNAGVSMAGHGPTTFRGRGRGRGGFGRGRGSSYGGGQYGQDQLGFNEGVGGQNTDAVILGGDSGGAVEGTGQTNGAYGSPPLAQQVQPSVTSVGSSGKMQKVGDKWVFVRGTPMDVS